MLPGSLEAEQRARTWGVALSVHLWPGLKGKAVELHCLQVYALNSPMHEDR